MPRRHLAARAGVVALAAIAIAAFLHAATEGQDGAAGPAALPPAAPEGPGPDRIVLSGCSGWQASAQFPPGTAPGSPPPGWQPSMGELSSVDLAGLLCMRLALGPFERGPVHVVLETHSNALVPEPCRSGLDGETPTVLAALLIDDADLAAELQRSHGLPARVATIRGDVTPLAAIESHGWTWAEGSDAPSRIEVLAEAAPVTGPESWHQRIFWPQGAGLGGLDLDIEALSPNILRPAAGHFEPPMLMASVAGGEFAGPGRWLPGLEAGGQFTHHSDLQCGAAA